jgi:hypothetical protein
MKNLCRKLDTCSKVIAVLDQDLAGDWQYADCIKKTCKGCKEAQLET